jgi:hypothetical protein
VCQPCAGGVPDLLSSAFVQGQRNREGPPEGVLDTCKRPIVYFGKGGVIQMINKCPACGKTAISVIDKLFLWAFKPVFKCKECGTELTLAKWRYLLIFSWAIIFSGLGIWLPISGLVKPRLLTQGGFMFFYTYIPYLFVYVRFVPPVKTSK